MNQNIGPVPRGKSKLTPAEFVDLMNAASMPKDRVSNPYRNA